MSDNESSNALDRNSMTFSTTKLFPMMFKDLGKDTTIKPDAAAGLFSDAESPRKFQAETT